MQAPARLSAVLLLGAAAAQDARAQDASEAATDTFGAGMPDADPQRSQHRPEGFGGGSSVLNGGMAGADPEAETTVGAGDAPPRHRQVSG